MIQDGGILERALHKLAQSYNTNDGTWRKSSKELDEIASVIDVDKWSKEFEEEIVQSIQRMINSRYPTTAIRENSGHCTQHIAENAVSRIKYRLLHKTEYT